MTGRDYDFEELRPLGEASRTPDPQLDDHTNADSRRQRSASIETGYPEQSTKDEAECRSCSAPIPSSQTKCRFCLTNHLDPATPDQSSPDTAQRLLDVVHLLVEASTFYGAVAKGSAAATLLVNSDSEPAIDDCQLIYDLDEAPAPQLTDQWPSLPSATQATSECGAQLLAAARERTTWTKTTRSSHDSEHATVLYDETGSGIRAEDRLASLREDAEDDLWLVPAITLQQSVGETKTKYSRCERPNREYLECRECGRDTEHRFREFEGVPNDKWTGQPMWDCHRCGTPRYGPKPETGQ